MFSSRNANINSNTIDVIGSHLDNLELNTEKNNALYLHKKGIENIGVKLTKEQFGSLKKRNKELTNEMKIMKPNYDAYTKFQKEKTKNRVKMNKYKVINGMRERIIEPNGQLDGTYKIKMGQKVLAKIKVDDFKVDEIETLECENDNDKYTNIYYYEISFPKPKNNKYNLIKLNKLINSICKIFEDGGDSTLNFYIINRLYYKFNNDEQIDNAKWWNNDDWEDYNDGEGLMY
jgi:hypothetical protein